MPEPEPMLPAASGEVNAYLGKGSKVAGKLTFDQDKFMAAVQSDPTAARKLLSGDSVTGGGFAQAFDDLLSPAVAAEGTLDHLRLTETRLRPKAQITPGRHGHGQAASSPSWRWRSSAISASVRSSS